MLHANAGLEHLSGRRPQDTALEAMTAILTRLNLEFPQWDQQVVHAVDPAGTNGSTEPRPRHLELLRDPGGIRVLLVSDPELPAFPEGERFDAGRVPPGLTDVWVIVFPTPVALAT